MMLAFFSFHGQYATMECVLSRHPVAGNNVPSIETRASFPYDLLHFIVVVVAVLYIYMTAAKVCVKDVTRVCLCGC